METTILIIAVIALFISVAFLAASNKNKKRELKVLRKNFDRVGANLQVCVQTKNDWENKYKELNKLYKDKCDSYNTKVSQLGTCRGKLDSALNKLVKMDDKFKDIEKELPNNLIALRNDDTIGHFRVKVVDEDDNFEGYNIGDKVAYVRRRINGKYQNVAIELQLVRE